MAADPSLGEALAPDEFALAERLSIAAVLGLPPGSCRLPTSLGPAGWLGLLVLEGFVARRVAVGGRTWTEVLGEGDLIPAAHAGRQPAGGLVGSESWDVLSSVRLAVLDRNFALRMSSWPEVVSTLTGRLEERIHSLTVALMACGHVGVADRLLLTLRHYANRWGRVTPEGVILRMPGLTHEVLAGQVGAARPSVTTALGELKRRRLVTQLGSAGWLLCPYDDAEASYGSTRPRRIA